MKIERDNKNFCHLVALSGGKDSAAMALRLKQIEPGPFTYICTPTGDELPEMFDHWKRLGSLLGQPILPIMGGTLKSICAEEGALPNFQMRFCTRQLKIAPFRAFLLRVMPAIAYVGLRADEETRDGAEYGLDLFVSQRFPLREWGWGLKEVMEYLATRGVKIPERTDCARCFFQRIGEWWKLWSLHPDIYADAVAQEEACGHTFRTPGKDSWPTSLKDLGAAFASGRKPERSIANLEERTGMCRVCTL